MRDDFQTALAAHVARLQAAADRDFAANYPNLKPPTISAGKPGKRYVRVVQTENSGAGRSVVHFVEISTGLIWKADGWKRPTRNFPRGNIYATDTKGRIFSVALMNDDVELRLHASVDDAGAYLSQLQNTCSARRTAGGRIVTSAEHALSEYITGWNAKGGKVVS
jgi:hypothetical protein